MKVAMLSSVPPDYGGSSGGGIAVHTVNLARGLAALGVEVHVLAHNVVRPDEESFRTPLGFYVHPFKPLRSRAGLGLALRRAGTLPWSVLARPDPRFTPRKRATVMLLGAQYRNLMDTLRPDLLHTHSAGYGRLAAGYAARKARIPFLATIHSFHLRPYRIEFLLGSVAGLKFARALIAVSEALKEQAITLGIPSERVTVVPNGVDLDAFQPQDRAEACRQLRLDPTGVHVLFVGHLTHRKGVDLLIRAVAQLWAQVPKVHLHLVGETSSDTNKAWRREMMTLPDSLGIRNAVTFWGPINSSIDPTLRLIYNASDMLVLPSRDEGMGIVLVEAMACGKPVVGTRVGGIPNVVRDGWNGLLVPPEDAEALARALTRLVQDPALAQRLGAQGLQDARTAYRWDDVAEKTLGVYRSLMASSAR